MLDYCQERLSEKIGLEDLAALCGLSRFQFLRRFAHSFGLTPHAWLVRLRLERACAALAGSGLSVAQVAAEVGFYDQSHFNRAFRVPMARRHRPISRAARHRQATPRRQLHAGNPMQAVSCGQRHARATAARSADRK